MQLQVARFCHRIWTLKPSTKFESSLHLQGREGLGQLASCLFPDFARGAWNETSSSHPKLTSATSHDVSSTRRGPRRDNRWKRRRMGWVRNFRAHPPRPSHDVSMRVSHQTAPIAVHITRTNTTDVELALRALAPSALHISRRNRRHVPQPVAGLRPIGSCKPSPSESYFATRHARRVKLGAVFLQMTEAKGGMGQWDDVVLLNSHFTQ
ncbi:hypothetical protein B0H19DRAFT_1071244 [Mycena capillaripes]|nr:hypothetical protein B0H19DRAFT_1071244 [Mycena capillaripes]